MSRTRPAPTKVSGEIGSIRDLRAAMVALALGLDENPHTDARLEIQAIGVSPRRLQAEWERFKAVLRPELAARLTLACVNPEVRQRPRLPRRQRFADILMVLVSRWLSAEPAISRAELGNQAGASYPTVAKALERLRPWVEDRTDRAARLTAFPAPEWQRWTHSRARAQSAARFADASGQPRSPASLLKRLRREVPDGVAIGGVVGAEAWYPKLDARGVPRLDLWVHCPDDVLALNFLQQLDPALKPVADPSAPASVVVHPVRRPQFLLQAEQSRTPVPIADPAQCLLDLHDLRLAHQAEAFVQHLKGRN